MNTLINTVKNNIDRIKSFYAIMAKVNGVKDKLTAGRKFIQGFAKVFAPIYKVVDYIDAALKKKFGGCWNKFLGKVFGKKIYLKICKYISVNDFLKGISGVVKTVMDALGISKLI